MLLRVPALILLGIIIVVVIVAIVVLLIMSGLSRRNNDMDITGPDPEVPAIEEREN